MTRRIGRWLLAGLVVGLGFVPAISRGAPLVYVQILARQDGTDNAFSATITPTFSGEEYDYMVIATLAPAGTQNTNLVNDPGTGTPVVSSYQSAGTGSPTDGLQGVVYSAYEAPSATTQVSFQNGQYLVGTNTEAGYVGPGGSTSIDTNITSGVTMKRGTSASTAVNGEALVAAGVPIRAYTFTVTGQQSSAMTLKPTGLVSTSAGGYALFNNYGTGSGATPGFAANRGNGNNDLVRAVPIGSSGTTGYFGVDPNTAVSGQTATTEMPYTVILADGSNAGGPNFGNGAAQPVSANPMGGDPNFNDTTFVVTSLGTGTSMLNLNYQDMNAGTPGGALTSTTNILNFAYHNSAGTYIQAGVSGSFQLAAQTGSDPVINYTGLTIIGSVISGNTSVLTFQPNTGSFPAALRGGTVSANVNLNNTPGNGTDVGSYSGVGTNGTSGPATGTANPGSNPVTLTLSGVGTASNTSTYSGTYTITNTSTGSTDVGGNKTVTMSAIVGNASADTSNVGGNTPNLGPALSSNQASLATYVGLASTVVGSSSGPILGGPLEFTTATLLQGRNNSGGPEVVSEAWRSRTKSETSVDQGGTPTSPPLQPSLAPLVSDVVSLSLGENPTQSTSVFVLQMNYDSTLDEQALLQSKGLIYLAWLNPNGLGTNVPEWQNAVNGNFGGGTTVDKNVDSSYAAFALANGITDANVGNFLGSWGVDLADNEVWAVLNHNSQFAVVPEPATIVLGAIGLLGLLGARLRKKS